MRKANVASLEARKCGSRNEWRRKSGKINAEEILNFVANETPTK